jgi:hypothetical protein
MLPLSGARTETSLLEPTDGELCRPIGASMGPAAIHLLWHLKSDLEISAASVAAITGDPGGVGDH